MKYIAWFSLILSILAIVPSAVSSIGFPFVLLSQIAGGVAFAGGSVKIALFSAAITLLS
jgi:hypothetical protein